MINTIIDSNIVTLGSNFISITLGLVGLFFLFEIKSVVIETLKPTFIYFIIADVILMCTRTLGIINELGIWTSTFYDSSIAIFSFFLLMGILSFYRFTSNINKQIEKDLQDKMTKLKRQESSLMNKDNGTNPDNSGLSERLSKVQYIKKQLSGI
jgi:hypothetical protein